MKGNGVSLKTEMEQADQQSQARARIVSLCLRAFRPRIVVQNDIKSEICLFEEKQNDEEQLIQRWKAATKNKETNLPFDSFKKEIQQKRFETKKKCDFYRKFDTPYILPGWIFFLPEMREKYPRIINTLIFKGFLFSPKMAYVMKTDDGRVLEQTICRYILKTPLDTIQKRIEAEYFAIYEFSIKIFNDYHKSRRKVSEITRAVEGTDEEYEIWRDTTSDDETFDFVLKTKATKIRQLNSLKKSYSVEVDTRIFKAQQMWLSTMARNEKRLRKIPLLTNELRTNSV